MSWLEEVGNRWQPSAPLTRGKEGEALPSYCPDQGEVKVSQG